MAPSTNVMVSSGDDAIAANKHYEEEKMEEGDISKAGTDVRLGEHQPNYSVTFKAAASMEKTDQEIKKAANDFAVCRQSSTSSYPEQHLNDDGHHAKISYASATAPPAVIGAQRVNGIYGLSDSSTTAAIADFDEYETASLASFSTNTTIDARTSLATPTSMLSFASSSSSYLVEATTVPELVSARAIPMPPITEESETPVDKIKFTKSESTRLRHRRRRALILATVVVVVVVALAVGIALGESLSKDHGASPDSNNNVKSISSNTTTSTPPTPSPTAFKSHVQVFATTLNSRRCDYGYMFDITAKTDLDIVGLQINMNTKTTQHVEVWTKEGLYHGYERNRSSWTLLGQGNVTPSSQSQMVPLPPDLFHAPLHISQNSRQALYITTPDKKVVCFQTKLSTLVGWVTYESVAYNTTDFDVHVGTGVEYQFGSFGKPSILSGIIEYQRTNS